MKNRNEFSQLMDCCDLLFITRITTSHMGKYYYSSWNKCDPVGAFNAYHIQFNFMSTEWKIKQYYIIKMISSALSACSYVMMMPFKRQALVEFEDVASADRCVGCGSREAVYIAGQQAYFNYSTSNRITRPTNADDPNSGNKVLLLSIQNPLYPITTVSRILISYFCMCRLYKEFFCILNLTICNTAFMW